MKLSMKNSDNSPETITDYIPIGTPSIYALLALMLAVLVVVIIWGNIGRVPLKLTVEGVGLNSVYGDESSFMDEDYNAEVDSFLCLVDPNIATGEKLNNKPATVILNDGTRISGYTSIVDTVPLTEDELQVELEQFYLKSHWALERLDTGGYRYAVSIILDRPLSYLQYGEIADVVIEIDQVPPIRYLMK